MTSAGVKIVSCSLVLASLLAPVGCAGGGSKDASGGSSEENAVVHQASRAEMDATRSRAPIPEGATALYVNGLGCPQCASNVDVQLMRLPGVRKADVDLSTGVVTIDVKGEKRPSPYQVSERVKDAGFTLVKLESGSHGARP